MKNSRFGVLRLVLASCIACGAATHPVRADAFTVNADVLVEKLGERGELPPLPDGVSELRFQDVYRMPAGPSGLEFTDAIRRLDGRRVRALGFMARQQRSSPGVLILAPFALTTSEDEYGLCDDLPPQVIFVSVPKYPDIAVPFTPGPMLLTGTLNLGPREEADGRVSHIRIQLDAESGPVAPAATPPPLSSR